MLFSFLPRFYAFRSNRSATLLCFLSALLLIVVVHAFYGSNRKRNYHIDAGRPFTLNVFSPTNLIENRRYIWFLETSNATQSFSATQLCAFESAARAHPNSDVNVLKVSSSLTFLPTGKQLLEELGNLHFLHIDVSDYMSGTPLQTWYDDTFRSKGKAGTEAEYAVNNLSNALRLLLLYQHGGVYFDSDVIVQKSLDGLRNTVGLQDKTIANNAVLVFDKKAPLLRAALNRFISDYKPGVWGNQGPHLLSYVISKLCNIRKPETCSQHVNILPTSAFYAINYGGWEQFFNPSQNRLVESQTRDSYVVHTWNHMNKLKKHRILSTSPYSRLASKYCPIVWNFSWK